MDRRRLLSGCATWVAVLVAGCGGLIGSESTSSGSPTDATPASGPTRTATPTPPPTPTATPTPTASPSPTPSTETARNALAAYRAGFEDRKAYDRSTEVARIGFERGIYGGAEIRYRDARDSARAGLAHFEEARDLAGQAGHPEAREIAHASVEYTKLFLLPFAEHGIDAAQAAQQGRFEDARTLVEEMASITSEARSARIEMAIPAEFEDALGL